MELRLAIVTAVRPSDCTLRWLGSPEELHADYGARVRGRIRVAPRQLVAVNAAADPPAVVWRWFRGVVIYRRDDHVVVDNHVDQPGFRAPISVVRLPEVLEQEVRVGDRVFYSLGEHGVVIDLARDDGPAHPARLAADMFPAIAEVYAEQHDRGVA